MRVKRAIVIGFLFVLSYGLSAVAERQEAYGSEVREFLRLMQHEENELEFQIQHNEISRKDYTRAKHRITLMRETVLDIVRKSGADIVPELHIVTSAELDQVLDGGLKSLRGVKAGSIVEERWRYLGRATRGEIFYIFERIRKK